MIRKIKMCLANPTVLIYQMGRVGSNTIRTLVESWDQPVYHTHTIMCEEGEFGKPSPEFNLSMELHKQENPWKIISLVREPIARGLSAFFWQIKKYYSGNTQTYRAEMLKAFIEKYPQEHTIRWFDKELIPFLDYDLYTTVPFDKEKGYMLYTTPLADLLILQTEMLNVKSKDALEEFFQRSLNHDVVEEGKSMGKPYGGAFQTFHEKVVFPKPFVDQLYSDKYVTHFYSERMIEEFKKKWFRLLL